MNNTWDLIVVGGGAAGYFAAITYAESSGNNAQILILERSPQVLGKVKISGGGRCNVTHACFDAKSLASHYPRGHKSLIGPFHRWGAADTIQWFESRGVALKTEPDGRMFPVSESSQSIVNCLIESVDDAGVVSQLSNGVASIVSNESSTARFTLITECGDTHHAQSILLATGGTRLAAGAKLATSLGHQLEPNSPSLFAFKLDDARLSGLAGLAVQKAQISVVGTKLTTHGPVLVTHNGLSGPGILKLSAWGACELYSRQYLFEISIDWLAGTDVTSAISATRQSWGKRLVIGRSPFDDFPKRLWKSICKAADVQDSTTWSQLSKSVSQRLISELTDGRYQVSGKSVNKDEFVTCGGVKLHEVNLKTMESKLTPGLYFAGEILNIDGVTGGFNFQNAWTTGYLAGSAAATTTQQ